MGERITALAPMRIGLIHGMGSPNAARRWSSNSLKFCVPANVTMPVSCGRGESSEK
ncbi:hypothetical protein EVA_03320 [gut metagenome]|uniref:Uncharacterized protein n=1 Tax=gut metagenome TaxID=749906 RepID=J9GM61_9ZZZZ